jgi:hypothetical protein
LQDSDDSEPSWTVEEVEEFCQSLSVVDFKSGVTGQAKNTWLDDRASSGGVREYKNPITSTALYHLLKELVRDSPLSNSHSKLTQIYQRFGKAGTPNADRRLM